MTDESAYKRSQLRLPHDLHAAIVKAAEENGRSMNNEIVSRLEASFEASAAPMAPDEMQSIVSFAMKTSLASLEKAQEKAIEGLERKVMNIVKMTLESAAKKAK